MKGQGTGQLQGSGCQDPMGSFLRVSLSAGTMLSPWHKAQRSPSERSPGGDGGFCVYSPARTGQGPFIDRPSKIASYGERVTSQRKTGAYHQKKEMILGIKNISSTGEVLELGVGEDYGVRKHIHSIQNIYYFGNKTTESKIQHNLFGWWGCAEKEFRGAEVKKKKR